MKLIRDMTHSERGRELVRLRRGIIRLVSIINEGGNRRCHEEENHLAALVDMQIYLSRKNGPMTDRDFRANCERYIARECRAGRLLMTDSPTPSDGRRRTIMDPRDRMIK
ncbi:MAG: hypothetical protein EXS68_03320 [Candidatus Ryanbacteria bacterium]|nr:hypothetical protein [Candidatus Ryanbacteria bacterium]